MNRLGRLASTTCALLLGTVLVAGAAEAATADQAQASYIVIFKDSVRETRSGGTRELARQLVAVQGGKLVYTYSAVKGFSAMLPVSAVASLKQNPQVAQIEPDGIGRAGGEQSNPVWGLDRIDQRGLPLSGSYTYPTVASNVTAYVVDSGVRVSHTQFGGRAVNGYDFVDRDGVAEDCVGHGTHVAGTIGGVTYGVAKGVKIVAVRVLACDNTALYSQIIAGVDWVTSHHRSRGGPSVANMSLTGGFSEALNTSVRRSVASGVTYAVAAGNGNINACNASPASEPTAITVGNSTRSDARAGTSNYGSCLDIWAPGTSVVSAWSTSNTATASLTGTSMASPHVAGAAAMVLSANPAWTPAQVRNYLVAGATTGVLTGTRSSPNRLLFVR